MNEFFKKASAISAFWKTHKCKLISNWMRKKPYDYLLISTWKNLRGRSARRFFLKPFFPIPEKVFSKFPYKIFVIVLLDIIGLENFPLSFNKSESRIIMCYLHRCYTFCTGLTLKLHSSQPIRIKQFFHVLVYY